MLKDWNRIRRLISEISVDEDTTKMAEISGEKVIDLDREVKGGGGLE